MWNHLGRREDTKAKKREEEEEQETQETNPEETRSPLPELRVGMFLEVLTMQNRLIFRGRIEEVQAEDSIVIVDAEGDSLPYVEYNTRIKLQGYQGNQAIGLIGLIGGSNKRLWKVDRLGALQSYNRRNYFRQMVSVEVALTRLSLRPGEEEADPETPAGRKALARRTYPGRMLDISAGGAMFYSKELLQIGERVSAKQVLLLEDQAPFDFTGVIRRAIQREDRWEYGVEFQELETREQERLIRMILLLQRKELKSRCGR